MSTHKTLRERMAEANAANAAAAASGVDTSRPLLPEGEYMAEFAGIGGFRKEDPLGWGISKEGTKNAGQPWATVQVTWKLNSKHAEDTLTTEKPMMFSKDSIFLTLSSMEEGTGIDFFKSNGLVNLIGTLLIGNGASKNGTVWNFEDFVLEGINGVNTNVAETFEFNAELKSDKGVACPENIQIAMAQMTGINKLLEDWNVGDSKLQANVFIIQDAVVDKSGKATDTKRNLVKRYSVFTQLED